MAQPTPPLASWPRQSSLLAELQALTDALDRLDAEAAEILAERRGSHLELEPITPPPPTRREMRATS